MERLKPIQYLPFLLFGIMAGCTASSTIPSVTPSTNPSPTVTTSPAPGPRAAKIFFQLGTGGSFSTPPNGGTAPGVGLGLQISNIFNPDGTLLSAVGGASWPAWISSVEIGISGASNTASLNPNCANFASSTESTSQNCYLGSPATLSNCGAPTGQFRISEVDCAYPTSSAPVTQPGTGAATDGVYIRVQFNRANLGTAENMLVSLEYAASAIDPAPANPTACFLGGQFLPENCSDFVWRIYLRHNMTEVIQPYLLLVPPTFSSVLGSGAPSGTSVATKQFVIPLAADQNLTYLQLSRTGSGFSTATSQATLLTTCTGLGSTLPGNSPLCAGMVFYSMTLFRI